MADKSKIRLAISHLIGGKWRTESGRLDTKKLAVPLGLATAVVSGALFPVLSSAESADPTLTCSVAMNGTSAVVSWNDIGQQSDYIYDHGVAVTSPGRSYVDTTPETSYTVVATRDGVKYRAACSAPAAPTTTTAPTTTAAPTTTTAAPTTTVRRLS